ncbi:ADP-ribose glycohydrolase MACROD1-like [Bufo bufo]|uniref:ADP-ribose glycohydrolase MACROD1-like n=1 Tax=Bufo bufo TaxID=8384 RepID=UPI001ABEC88F|nr:ADP-ribose glycohydrolase MACROD1-like [Bufo bufo]
MTSTVLRQRRFRSLWHCYTVDAVLRIAQDPYSLLTCYRALHPQSCCFTTRPLTSSACTMAGKIDLNSPSTSWKEAKTFLKSLNSKQRREHYSVKDFVKLKEIPAWKDTAKKARARQPEEVKFPKSKDLNEKISLVRGDITKLEVDAIVNTDPPDCFLNDPAERSYSTLLDK